MSAADAARLAHLLEVQGQLIDAYLAQNMGERYAYLLLACPRAEPENILEARRVEHVTNIRPALAEHIALVFGERVKRIDAASLVDALAPAPIPGGFDVAR